MSGFYGVLIGSDGISVTQVEGNIVQDDDGTYSGELSYEYGAPLRTGFYELRPGSLQSLVCEIKELNGNGRTASFRAEGVYDAQEK